MTSQKSGILKLNLWVSEMMGFNGDVNSGCPSDPPPTPNPTLICSSGLRAGPGVLVSTGESGKLSPLLACFSRTCVATVIRLTWMHLRTSDRLGFTRVCRGGATLLATTTAWETASRRRCSWDGPRPPLPPHRDPADPNPPPGGQNRAGDSYQGRASNGGETLSCSGHFVSVGMETGLLRCWPRPLLTPT